MFEASVTIIGEPISVVVSTLCREVALEAARSALKSSVFIRYHLTDCENYLFLKSVDTDPVNCLTIPNDNLLACYLHEVMPLVVSLVVKDALNFENHPDQASHETFYFSSAQDVYRFYHQISLRPQMNFPHMIPAINQPDTRENVKIKASVTDSQIERMQEYEHFRHYVQVFPGLELETKQPYRESDIKQLVSAKISMSPKGIYQIDCQANQLIVRRVNILLPLRLAGRRIPISSVKRLFHWNDWPALISLLHEDQHGRLRIELWLFPRRYNYENVTAFLLYIQLQSRKAGGDKAVRHRSKSTGDFQSEGNKVKTRKCVSITESKFRAGPFWKDEITYKNTNLDD